MKNPPTVGASHRGVNVERTVEREALSVAVQHRYLPLYGEQCNDGRKRPV